MRFIITGILCLPLLFAATAMGAADDSVTVPNCLLSMNEEAEVPAQEAGVLIKIPVREGQAVAKGETLAQIDDALAKMQYNIAYYKLKAAEKEAADDIGIRYAEAAAKVAKAEYDQARDANNKFPGTVPLAEERRLLLKHREMVLSIEKSQKEMALAALQVKVSEAELKAAEAKLEHYHATSPLDAVVVEFSRHEGEWVQPGDPLMRLVRVDRLRAEGYVSASNYSAAEIKGRPVNVIVTLARGRKETFPGKIVYVKPLIEAGGQFLVRAEVDNRKQGDIWLLSPGLSAEMIIKLR